ncbi:MAG: 4Fe-4S binding protein [Candidatus Micrarchaeota archaeon]
MKLPVSPAGSSVQNKTGSWRSDRPFVSEKCIGCGICVRFCPDRCMELIDKPNASGKIVKIDLDYCKGCGVCANECPVKAILMKREQECRDAENVKNGEVKK